MTSSLHCMVFCVLGAAILATNPPPNPCMQWFQYVQMEGYVFGRMEFPSDFSGHFHLEVNMSIAAYLTTNRNIRLQLKTATEALQMGASAEYYVHFPLQQLLPRPTQILFNGHVYCFGPPEELRPGRYVTNMWAAHIFRPGIHAQRPQIPSQPIAPTAPAPPTPPETPLRPPVTPFHPEAPPLNPEATPVHPETPPFHSEATPIQPEATPTHTEAPPSNRPFQNNPFLSHYPDSDIPTSFATIRPQTVTSPPTQPHLIDRNSLDAECGQSSRDGLELVLNGETIRDGEYPWLVAIMYRRKLNYNYRCTGSLITDKHVITAAHCVKYYNALLFPAQDLLLVFGKHNLLNWANGAVLRDVKSIHVHPAYKQSRPDCDVAILLLDEPIVNFDKYVRPVCLWSGGDDSLSRIVGVEGTIGGWGRDDNGLDVAEEAKKTQLPVVSQEECLRSHPSFFNLTSPRTFCAGKRDGSGPCSGDSGSGFILRNIDNNNKWTLRGIVSTSLSDTGTCDVTNYFIFVDIAKVMNWIQNTMQ